MKAGSDKCSDTVCQGQHLHQVVVDKQHVGSESHVPPGVGWLKSGAVCEEVDGRGSSSGCSSTLPVWDGNWDRKMKRSAPLKKHRIRKRGLAKLKNHWSDCGEDGLGVAQPSLL